MKQHDFLSTEVHTEELIGQTKPTQPTVKCQKASPAPKKTSSKPTTSQTSHASSTSVRNKTTTQSSTRNKTARPGRFLRKLLFRARFLFFLFAPLRFLTFGFRRMFYRHWLQMFNRRETDADEDMEFAIWYWYYRKSNRDPSFLRALIAFIISLFLFKPGYEDTDEWHSI